MNATVKKYGPYISALIYLLLFTATVNWYQYNFDVDGVAYMTIAKRIADGDWFKSINGLWSPLSCYIASLFLKYFSSPVICFKVINAVCCTGIIISTGVLLNRFLKTTVLQAIILAILPVLLLAWTHQQLAGDLLSLWLMLIYCCLITSGNFFKKESLYIYCAVVMAMAYLAKSYCLPFFIVNHLLIHFYYWRQNKIPVTGKIISARIIIPFIVFFFIAAAWIYCLYLKYNRFTFSTAGTLNYNWYLGNGPSSIKDYGLLIPPPYPDSPNFWEDPFTYYNHFSGPLSSSTNFLRAVKLGLHNCKESIGLFTEMSLVILPVFIYWVIRLIKTKAKENFFSIGLLLIASAVLTTGYLLIHIETRYLWLTGIIGLILAAKLFEEKILSFIPGKILSGVILFLFAGSFLISPVDKLQDLKYSGKDIYETAEFLSSGNIKGNFTSNYSTNAQNSWCTKLAFLSHNRFYLLAKNDYTQTELITAARQNNIRFYLYFYTTTADKEMFLNSPMAIAAKQITNMPGKNILVVQFQ